MRDVTIDPIAFSVSWVQAWNRHDIEAVLAHFDEQVVFSSPVAARVVPASCGVVRGKGALREYWTTALAQNPHLKYHPQRARRRPSRSGPRRADRRGCRR